MGKKVIIIVASLIAVCAIFWFIFKPAPETKFIELHEAGVQLEDNKGNKFEELQKLMDRENELYIQIIDGGKKDASKVETLIEEAKKTISVSKGLIKDTTTVFHEAYKTTEKSFSYSDDIGDKKLKKNANDLSKLYKERFETYKKMSQSYTKILSTESELYQKLGSKDSTIKEISEKISALDNMYKEVTKLEEKFNSITNEYNKVKKSFYKNLSA